MLTEYETQKLLKQMEPELNASPEVVLKCAVMLLLLFVLAGIGSIGERDRQTPYANHLLPCKERASRIVFEERRRLNNKLADYPATVEVARSGKRAGSDAGYRPVSDRGPLNPPTEE